MKKNLLLCLIFLIIIRNIMTREEFKAEMAEKKERAEARINSALQTFADMIIARMETIEASSWKKGWTDGEAMIGLPQNVTGRVYTGSNAFLCQLDTTLKNYKVPVYFTIKQIKDLGAFPKKGEKSIPIFKWGLSIYNRETGKKATLKEYDSLPKEERDEKYKVIPYLKIFNEWNIDQTNLEEVNKDKYDALLSKFEAKEIKDDIGMYSNAAIDQMLASQSWVCPIEYTQQNPSAHYNKSKDVIIVPRKDQFNISDTPEEIYKDGEEYYSSLIHEMAHSTGHESRLNRLNPDGKFGGEEYAKEELVAELTAAMVGSALGFDSRIRDNNTAYLKSWMSALKKEPKFLLSVMSDVNKASAMVIEHIDEERVKLGEKALLDGNLDGEEEREKNEKEMQEIVNDTTEEKESLPSLRESGNDMVLEGIISVAKEWDSLAEKPTVEMESGDILPVEYNKEKDTLDVLITNGAGKQEVYSTNYDHDRSIKENLGYLWEELSNMKQYQAEEVKQETSSKTAKDSGDGLKEEPEINDKEDNSVPIEEGKEGLTPKEYFSTLMESITDGQHDGHTALGIKNISELRDYFKDNHNVSEWVANATDKEIIEAGADMLPNIRYNHKEGRTLYDMTAAYSNINAKYEDVTDDRTRQIAHRIDQAKSIITAYQTNIENAHGENYLFEEESAHKIIPREEYAASISQEQAATLEKPIDESYHYSFARFESSERTKAFDSYRESGDHEALLHLAEIMDVNNLIELNKVRKNAPKTSEDKVLVENSSYAVTYNQQNSTYDLLRKIEKEKVLELIGDINDNDEIKASSHDVQKLAYEDAAKQMAEFAEHEPRFLTMPNRELLDFQYNEASNQIEVGKMTSEGMDLQYTYDYDLSSSPEHNLSIVHNDLAGLDEFRMLSVEEIEQREKIALSWRITDNKLEMPSGDVLTVEYDKEKDTLSVAYTTEDGKPEIYSTKYNHEGSTTKNVGDLWQKFANMKQYQSTPEASLEKENKEKASATQEKKGEVYYYSFAYLQSTDDTQEFDNLKRKGHYKQILQLAQTYDQGDAMEQSDTFKNAKKYSGDDILDEDDNYAVVYNGSVGGTYDLMRKVTKEEILDDIDRYGLEQDASEDVKKVAYESVAKQFSEIKAQIPAFTMPNNDVLYFQYNQEKNQVEVGHVTNIGLMKEHTFDYDVNQTLDANLEAINESLQENEEYQAIEEDEEEAKSIAEEQQHQEYHDEEKQNSDKMDKKIFYSNLSDTSDIDLKEDPQQLAAFYENGDKQGLFDALKQAQKESGASWDLTTLESTIGENAEIIAEDEKHIAVKYPYFISGTFFMFEKVTEQQILDKIQQQGLSKDDSEIAHQIGKEAIKKQFDGMRSHTLEMPNGTVLGVDYDPSTNEMLAGGITNAGLAPEHRSDYDHSITLDENLQNFAKELMSMNEYQALDKDNQVEVPREDSNIETDVAGMAKQFVAEGMSMEEAEQKAKSIAEEQQHQEYHDEEKQKDAEQKQQQKKQEEQAKKEEEKKPVSHAALLFAALGLASEKNGVWMNRAQRQPAEFIHSHTPVTAYNSIMMTLNTDANKYKTNVYTFYKTAAENNMPVKRNEESLRFNWVKWDYQSMMNHDDIITQKKYDSLSDEEKSFYAKHASRVVEHIYNVDQTIMNAKDHEAYGNLVKTKGAPFVKAEEKIISVLQQYNDYQKKHPDIVVLNKTGDFYEIYGKKASDVAKILNLEVEKKKMDRKKVDLVSFPSQHLDTYLPKIIRAGNRVSINDNLKEKKVSISVQDNTAILNKAYSTAKAVADQSGMKYERKMVVQDAKYDKVDDKIVVSGMSEKTADENHATLYKANDIYRAVVAAVGSENRLDRSGRNSFLPEDDAKHEKLVQELAAGVLMTRQGLPAILSKESEKLVPYWQRELTENPKMLGVLERDVNNAVETIDSILAKRKVDYKAIRGQMPGKILTENPERFSISSSLAKLPSMETKEMVVVLDKKHKTADVILPAGASLQVNNEVPGMSKKRILTALGKMGVKEVSFYNAGGGLSLHESNDYYKGKEVTVSKLKQYELLTQQTVDLKDKFAPKKDVKITTFEALPDDMGRYAFFIKAENEPAFAVYPNKEHVNQFYSSLKSENRAVVHNALAKKYYELGTKHPDARVDVITPRKVNIGDAKIDRICITAKRNDPKQHIIFATVNGERMHAPVSKAQWNKMWLSEDMSDYKQRLAAVIFEPFIKKEVKNDVKQQASEKTDETVKPDSPAPEKEQEEQVEQTSRKGRGIH